MSYTVVAVLEARYVWVSVHERTSNVVRTNHCTHEARGSRAESSTCWNTVSDRNRHTFGRRLVEQRQNDQLFIMLGFEGPIRWHSVGTVGRHCTHKWGIFNVLIKVHNFFLCKDIHWSPWIIVRPRRLLLLLLLLRVSSLSSWKEEVGTVSNTNMVSQNK